MRRRRRIFVPPPEPHLGRAADRRSVVSALDFGCVIRNFPDAAVAVCRAPDGVAEVTVTWPFVASTSEPLGIAWPVPRTTNFCVPGVLTLTTPADVFATTASPAAGAAVACTPSDDALFVVSGSPSAAETVASTESAPPPAGTDVTLIVFLIVTLSPGCNVPSWHPHVSAGRIALTPPDCSNAASRTTPLASPGPLFVTVIANVTWSPAPTDCTSALVLTARSAACAGETTRSAKCAKSSGAAG